MWFPWPSTKFGSPALLPHPAAILYPSPLVRCAVVWIPGPLALHPVNKTFLRSPDTNILGSCYKAVLESVQGLGNPPGVDKEKTIKDQSLKEFTFPLSYIMTFNCEQIRIIPQSMFSCVYPESLQNPGFCFVLITSLGFHWEFLQYAKMLIGEQETFWKNFMTYNFSLGELDLFLMYKRIFVPYLLRENLLP